MTTAMKTVNSKKLSAIITAAVCLIIFTWVLGFNFKEIFLSDAMPENKNADFVEVIDVGQGDSILISSNDTVALIDTGLSTAFEAVSSTLDKYKIKKIDVLIITHLDNDHSGAVGKISELYTIDNLILPEISIESEGLGSAELAIARVTDSGGNIYNAKQGMNFKIGNFELTVLASYTDMNEENNRSIVTMAKIGTKKFLFTGDIELKAEKALLEEGLDLKCDVLKVAHHGSSTSSSDDFLYAANPEMAVISVGHDNIYGQPHNEVLAAFERLGCEVFRTDIMGNIIFTVKNEMITVKTER